jgi:methionine-rich copper-binding protein CopC
VRKPYSEWSNREHEKMLRMRQEGFTVREIAEAIGRSFHAVASRVQQRKAIGRVKVVKSSSPARLRITIEKSQVPDLYERGWRFVGFDGEQCIFELGAA